MQTFKLPQPTSFHRFIRLDFPSYFGTEYYCPVSQLKVYGMNQMEAFKWEQKRISAAAKEKEKEKEKNGSNRDKEAEERKAKEERELKERRAKDEKVKQEMREKELDELEKLLHEQAGRVVPDILTETAILSKLHQSSSVQTHIQTPSTKIGKASNPGSLSTVPTRKDKDISSTPAASSPTKRSNASAVVIESEEAGTNTSTRSSSTTTLSIASSLSSTGTTKTAAQSLKTITDTPVSTSTYSRSPPPRSDSSESIYAFIIRRLNALEGNSTLVARYIEEQAKVMRHMLTRVERGWEDWKGEWEGDDRGRWEQERMRQEDRLGRVISQLEQQKTAMEVERKEIQSQLRVLADELGYERRRGLAQLLIMFVIIVLGVITRSSTIDAVLKPLLAEAKRRRSMRKSFSGPLTGLRIDMGLGRPPAVIGQGRPRQESGAQLDQPSQRRADDRVLNGRGGENSGKQRPDARNEEDKARAASPASPTPVSVHRSRHAGNRHSISRRPGTPTSSSSMRQRRLPPGVISSNYRSVSATDTIPTAAFSPSSSSALPTSAVSGADGSGSGSGSVFLHSGLTSPAYKPQPRISLNAPRAGGLAGPSRRLARSAHLHTMEADKLRHELKAGKSRALSVAEPGPSGQSPSSSGTASSGHFGEADDGVHGAVDQTPKRSTSLLVDHQQHHVQSHSQPIHHGPFAPRSGPEHTLRLRENEISPFTVQLNDGRMPNALPIDTDEDRRDREYNLLGQNSDHGGGGNDRDHDTDGPSDWGTDVETEDSVSEVEVDVHHLKERKQPGQANESGMTLTSSQQAVIDELDGIWNGSGPNGVDVKVKTTGTHDADIKDLRKER
ncbi:hypothetical protein I317_06558 [Kwoniella heveanensis CBS 569]|nr:hypothetical protein I317_06558 [Kwoniella heveanensis CBS 569]